MPILLPFLTYKQEADIIGRLLSDYTNLEIGLMNCIQVASGDFDATLKIMFGKRGETDRILWAAQLGEPHYKALKLDREFRMAIGAMRHCLKIMNQYSHSVWHNDWSGHLAFANIEDIALLDEIQTALQHHLPTDHICLFILQLQEEYFSYVTKLLSWINFEGRYKAGKISTRFYPKPPRMKQPPLRLPREGCTFRKLCLGPSPDRGPHMKAKPSAGPTKRIPPLAGQL
jgi:hypothetical protein